jgi:hypothetical protein
MSWTLISYSRIALHPGLCLGDFCATELVSREGFLSEYCIGTAKSYRVDHHELSIIVLYYVEAVCCAMGVVGGMVNLCVLWSTIQWNSD